MSGSGVWFFTRNIFHLTQSAATLALSIPAWGHLCGWGIPYCRDYTCPIRIASLDGPVLTCDWNLDIDEGLIEFGGSCRFLWNPHILEFYPEERNAKEKLEGLGSHGQDGLVSHHFPAFRQWAKEKGQPAKDWLRKLREGCELESSRVLIDMILG
jgi:hypothetical protein